MFIIFLAVNFLSVYYFFICLLLFYLFIIFFSALFVWYVNHFLYLYLLIITFLAVYDFYVMVIIFCLLIIILLYVTLLIIIFIILLNHLSTLVMAIVSCFIILFIKLWLLLIIITWRTYLIILNKCNPSSQWHLIILNIQFTHFLSPGGPIHRWDLSVSVGPSAKTCWSSTQSPSRLWQRPPSANLERVPGAVWRRAHRRAVRSNGRQRQHQWGRILQKGLLGIVPVLYDRS